MPETTIAHVSRGVRVRSRVNKLVGRTVSKQTGNTIRVDWEGLGEFPANVANLVIIAE